MNDSRPDLFARYDPLIKMLPLFRQLYDDGSGGILAVRPVWIIGDLIIIHEWLGSDLKKTNWHLNQHRMAVMLHYKQLLLSGNAQSFMVEQNNLPVIQIDLLPGTLTDYPSQIEFGQKAYVLNYLYKECFRDPDIFRRCLQCMIRFIFSYTDINILYLRLLKAESGTDRILGQIGFEPVDLNNFFGKSLNIYKINRAGI